jgi:isopenicillin N synthase-like dioxygenase
MNAPAYKDNRTQTIPVVSLQDFKSPDPQVRGQFIQTMGNALRDIGFFALTDHGVDTALIKKAYNTALEYYLLPTETKMTSSIPSLKGQRGYVGFGVEHAKGHQAPDLKEFYHIGRELAQAPDLKPSSVPNVWPNQPISFKDTFSKLFAQLDVCADLLLQACGLYLGESQRFIADMAQGGESLLRVIHYPPISADRDPASIRAAAHEDINLITILCESTDEGLELLQKDGTWLPIHALDGQLIVDSGDMIQNLTNGYLKSTTHRVVNPGNDRSRRMSMPFFVHPRAEVSLNPLASCVAKTGGQINYPNQTAAEYLAKRLAEIGLGKY